MNVNVDAVQHNVFRIVDAVDEDCNVAIGGKVAFFYERQKS
jgi:hypothetical protein